MTHWTADKFIKPLQVTENTVIVEALDHNILDWKQSLQLAANKEDLAQDLLKMLVDSFPTELTEIEQLIELEDFPQLEHVLHRLYGATRYVGVPKLQKTTGEFEQFVSTLRKERKKADDAFIYHTQQCFDELQLVIHEVESAAKQVLNF